MELKQRKQAKTSTAAGKDIQAGDKKKKLGIELLLSYLGIFLLLLLETEVLDVDCLLFGNTLLH